MIMDKRSKRLGVKWSLVQILVVVAAIQTRYICIVTVKNRSLYIKVALKSVVENASLRVALMQGLVGPKRQAKANKQNYDSRERELN